MVLPGFRKLLDHQMGSRPPNTDHDLFWWKCDFAKCFGDSRSNNWAGCHWLSYKTLFSSHIAIWSRNGSLLLSTVREDNISKQWFFWSAVSSRGWLINFFHLSNLLQMPNDQRMVNFSRSFHRISFHDCSQLAVVNSQWPTTMSIFKALISFAKFLEAPLHCTLTSSSWAKCYCWCCKSFSTTLWLILNSKNHSNLLFV